MILVTGATGQLGSSVIKKLLKHMPANEIVAFARDENKAEDLMKKGIEVRYGTFEDTDSLDRAMIGIEKTLLISTIDHHRLQQHKNVVDAAKKAGVKHILYTSATIKNVETSAIKDLMESHFQTEDYIKKSGLKYTFMRNSLYMDVIPFYVGKNVLEIGVILPAGKGKVAYTLRREIGEATANVLLQNGHENKIYDITGSELYAYEDIAKALSELSGKSITYTDIEPTKLLEQLKQAGTPELVAKVIIGFATDIKNHQFEIVSEDMENLLKRKPTPLKKALKELYNL
ncbi:MAG TPA: SDR family oxidoreductase [Edaphocola sp.]|nr:SDR family oxidoreductase [Edaphocola sp.]